MMKFILVLTAFVTTGLFNMPKAEARDSSPIIRCAAGGDFGNDGLVIELFPIRGNPDAFWAVHTEITPGGGHEYMRVFVFIERTKNLLSFAGGPLQLKLLLAEPKVESVEGDLLTVAEVDTVNSFGHPEVYKKPKSGAENFEYFLCENRLK